MRKSDIHQAPQAPGFHRTEEMYIDTDKPVDQMSLPELQRTLCAKANGDVLACEECKSRYKFGKRIVELLKPVEEERRAPNTRRVAAGKAGGEVKRAQARRKYLTALASGNPKKWFEENGFNARGGMQLLRKALGNMTPEEAREELRGPSVEIRPVNEVTPVAVKKPLSSPRPSLKITSVRGIFHDYKINESGEFTVVLPEPGENYIPFCKIPELCAELQQLYEMLGGAEDDNP